MSWLREKRGRRIYRVPACSSFFFPMLPTKQKNEKAFVLFFFFFSLLSIWLLNPIRHGTARISQINKKKKLKEQKRNKRVFRWVCSVQKIDIPPKSPLPTQRKKRGSMASPGAIPTRFFNADQPPSQSVGVQNYQGILSRWWRDPFFSFKNKSLDKWNGQNFKLFNKDRGK